MRSGFGGMQAAGETSTAEVMMCSEATDGGEGAGWGAGGECGEGGEC